MANRPLIVTQRSSVAHRTTASVCVVFCLLGIGLSAGAQELTPVPNSKEMLRRHFGHQAQAVISATRPPLQNASALPVPASNAKLAVVHNFAGGAAGYGVVFKVNPSGHETVVHSFTGGRDGGNPFVGVILCPDGSLYGTADIGGTENAGVVYKITL